MEQEILKDIKRIVPHIARLHGVHTDEVEKVIRKYFREPNLYIFIPWPDVQEYMEYEGFSENSTLCNDDETLEEYGSQCYFVSKDWLDQIKD